MLVCVYVCVHVQLKTQRSDSSVSLSWISWTHPRFKALLTSLSVRAELPLPLPSHLMTPLPLCSLCGPVIHWAGQAWSTNAFNLWSTIWLTDWGREDGCWAKPHVLHYFSAVGVGGAVMFLNNTVGARKGLVTVKVIRYNRKCSPWQRHVLQGGAVNYPSQHKSGF